MALGASVGLEEREGGSEGPAQLHVEERLPRRLRRLQLFLLRLIRLTLSLLGLTALLKSLNLLINGQI